MFGMAWQRDKNGNDMALHPKTKRFQRVSLRPEVLPVGDKRSRRQMAIGLDNINLIDPEDPHFRAMFKICRGIS